MNDIEEAAQQVRQSLDAIQKRIGEGRLTRAQARYLTEKLRGIRQRLEEPAPPRVHTNGHSSTPVEYSVQARGKVVSCN